MNYSRTTTKRLKKCQYLFETDGAVQVQEFLFLPTQSR